MTAFELGAFSTEVKPNVSGTSVPAAPGNSTQTAVPEPQFKCGTENITENSSPPAPTWTPERVERLQQLLEKGLSTAQIGRRLGLTKNAVIGRCWRQAQALPLAKKPFVPYTPPHDVFNGGGCLWPYGDPGDARFHFCGAHSTMASIGSSWCSIHSAIVFRKSDTTDE